MAEFPAFEPTVSENVLRIRRAGTTWLSTGWNGGRIRSDTAYNVSVPEGWRCPDIESYVRTRLRRAGFLEGEELTQPGGPTLLTGVDLEHARGAHCGPVTAYATAGVSNPAALPLEPTGGSLPDGVPACGEDDYESTSPEDHSTDSRPAGTVNVIVATTCRLEAGALTNLIAVAAEAKARTLLGRTGFPGTTTDAIVAGHDPAGPGRAFSGSLTDVGAATRACVREAVTASLESRYSVEEAAVPESVTAAKHGTATDVRATVFCP